VIEKEKEGVNTLFFLCENKRYADKRKHNVILWRGISGLRVVLYSGNSGNLLSNEKWARVRVKYKTGVDNLV